MFIVASGLGDVRLFDRRRLGVDPGAAAVNVYRNINLEPPHASAALLFVLSKLTRALLRRFEMTGCTFTNDGRQIIATTLNDHIYAFDTATNFEEQLRVDLFRAPQPPQAEDGGEAQPAPLL